ncbi:hypothetical protein [Mastigocoleus testarum]|nr:hypothetical protein [Mastigocoleus testarum]
MREGSVGGVGSVGGNPKKYQGVLKIGFGIKLLGALIIEALNSKSLPK